jgi:hypothetical protein
MREETRHQRSGDRRRFECATGRTRYKRVKVLEVRALVVDSRSACVAVGSPPPGARACARARLREARIFPFARGAVVGFADPSTCVDRPSLRARASLSKTVCSYDCDFFYRRAAASEPRCENPPRAPHTASREARAASPLRSFRGVFSPRSGRALRKPLRGRPRWGAPCTRRRRSSRTPRWTSRTGTFARTSSSRSTSAGRPTTSSRGGASTTATCTRSASTKSGVARARDEGVRLANPPPRSDRPAPAALQKIPGPQIDRSSIAPPVPPSTTPPSAPSESLRAEPLTPRRPPRPPEQIHDARLAAEGRPALKTGCAGGSTRRERRRASSTAGGVPTRRDGREKKKQLYRTVQSDLSAPRRPSRPPLPLSTVRPAPLPRPRLGVVVIGARAAGRPSPLRYGSRASRRRREMKFLSRPGGGGARVYY